MKTWIVGQVVAGMWNFREESWGDLRQWEINGVFDTKEKAVSACRDESYFVMPLNMNESLPHERVEIEGAYYPLEKAGDS